MNLPNECVVFLDIDGTLVRHDESHIAERYEKGKYQDILLPGTIEKLIQWDRKGYKIILTTGRRECWRKVTEENLERLGVFYDQLIMGCGAGRRILINDLKPYHPEIPTAEAYCIKRNEGIASLDF